MQYTHELPASAFFRQWGGIALVSCALTRRVYSRTKLTFPPLYPNLFILLTGDPGTGKDIVIAPVRRLLKEASDRFPKESRRGLNLGQKSLSAKGLVDAINNDKALLHAGPGQLNGHGYREPTKFHSLTICVPELGVLFPEYNTSLASILCDLWNCDDIFDEITRNGRGEPISVENPHIGALLGTQPSYLATTFPEEAYSMGLFARIILCFEEQPLITDLYDECESEEILKENHAKYEKEWKQLVSDVQAVMELNGQFKTTLEAKKYANHFRRVTGPKTALSHSRFQNYNTRRSMTLAKLGMIFSAAESSSLIVETKHFEQAERTLLEAEQKMVRVFANISSSHGFHDTVEELTINRKTISHRELEAKLRRRHRPTEIPHIIQNMRASGKLREVIPTDGKMSIFPTYEVRTEDFDD